MKDVVEENRLNTTYSFFGHEPFGSLFVSFKIFLISKSKLLPHRCVKMD